MPGRSAGPGRQTEAVDVREARPEDVGTLGLASPHKPHRERVEREDATYLVAVERGGNVVGHVLVRWAGLRADWDEGRWPLPPDVSLLAVPAVEDLWVAEGARRRGIGTALMESAESAVRAAGNARIVLGVSTLNEPGRNLYYSLGYAHTGAPEHDESGTLLNGETWLEPRVVLLAKELG